MIFMTWTLDFLRDMNVPQKVLLLFKRAQCMTIRHRHKNWKTTSNFAWIGKTRFLTGTGRRGRRAADSAARLRLVLTSCRQGRLTGLGLLTLQKRWSTKLQSHLKNSNNVKTASQKYSCVSIIRTVLISGGSYCLFSLLHYSPYYTYLYCLYIHIYWTSTSPEPYNDKLRDQYIMRDFIT